MILKILIAIAAILVVLVVVIATRPTEFRVERAATISAPAPVVFALVNDFHKWEAWSPYALREPGMKKTFEGDRTAVTWSLDGRNSFPAKAMGLVMNTDRMIGDDFEKGLAQIKAIAEATPRP